MPYETFDIDLLEGKAREDAFAYVLTKSRFEHKRDYECLKTGNIAIEYQQICSDGIKRPSGIAATEAEWWVVEYFHDCRLVVPTEVAKRLARKARDEGRHRWIGDGENHHNALVPIGWFINPRSIFSEQEIETILKLHGRGNTSMKRG